MFRPRVQMEKRVEIKVKFPYRLIVIRLVKALRRHETIYHKKRKEQIITSSYFHICICTVFSFILELQDHASRREVRDALSCSFLASFH
jgi:hypothetical protein